MRQWVFLFHFFFLSVFVFSVSLCLCGSILYILRRRLFLECLVGLRLGGGSLKEHTPQHLPKGRIARLGERFHPITLAATFAEAVQPFLIEQDDGTIAVGQTVAEV